MPHTRYEVAQRASSFADLPAAALRACLREGYSKEKLRADLLAGLVVGIVALPLSMALAIAVGVAPQHGLYTAIVAGLVVSLLGGSRVQVTGPTAAFVVILAPIQTRFGLAGLATAGLMAGIIILGLALARMGKLLQFIPHPVTTGFTAGIAVVIGTLQLKDFLGLTVAHMPEHYLERVGALVMALPTVSLPSVAIGVFTLAVLVWFPKITSRVPSPLVAVLLASGVALVASELFPGFAVETIGGRFRVPAAPPSFVLPWNLDPPVGAAFRLDLATLRALLPAAFAIAMLGSIESLLSAVVADGMMGTKHDPDAELFALGVGNVIAPFFGGIAATGAIARTATNIRAGGRTPIASATHALVILVMTVALAPMLRYIPMAALAALLLMVAWRMSEVKHFLHIARVAPGSDVAVLLTCFGLTVVFDMVVGVTVGIVLAALLFMRRMAEVTQTTIVTGSSKTHGEVPPGVIVYDIAGPLFFGAAEKAMGALKSISREAKVVVLELDDVSAMDATGLVALESVLAHIEKAGAMAILTCVQPQPLGVLARAHIVERPGKLAFRPDLAAGLELAKLHVTGATAPVTTGGLTQSVK